MRLSPQRMAIEERNLRPHAEAIMAMTLFANEYGEQRGGCMEFWDALPPSKQDRCRQAVTRLIAAFQSVGRAPTSDGR